MPAEILFVGGRFDSMQIIAGTPIESTSATGRDATYVDATILMASSGDLVQATLKTATSSVLSDTTVVTGETFWAHWDNYVQGSSNTTRTAIIIRDSSGFDWFRATGNGQNGLYTFQWNSGTGASPVWTTLGTVSVGGPGGGAFQQMDISVALGSPHAVNFYINGSLLGSWTFTQALFTNVQRMLWGPSYSGANNISQIMLTRDISTIGAKVRYSRATGAGANTGWTGTFADVNEAVNNDTTLNSSASAGQKESHVMGDVTVPAGMEIKAVFHWLRAKNDGSSPTNIRSLLRSGGTDYVTGNLSGIGLGYASIGARYEQDPATASNWIEAGWNAYEAGYESAT